MDTYLAVASKRDERRYADRPLADETVGRILDAGRLSGSSRNTQPWLFVVVRDRDALERLSSTVYAPENVRGAALAVAVATPDGKRAFDVGRAAQNMMLVAWNEAVTSCPNGLRDADEAARVLGLEDGLRLVIVLSFGYRATPREAEARPAEEWSARARRKPLDDVVRRI